MLNNEITANDEQGEPVKVYTCETCHEIGYGWEITAPEGLDEEDIKAMVDALIDYTDEPNQRNLGYMLNDEGYTEKLDQNKMELFRKVEIEVDCVARNMFSQSFSEGEKSTRASVKDSGEPDDKKSLIIVDVASELDARGMVADIEAVKAAVERAIRYELENHFTDTLENAGVEITYTDE